MLGIPKMCFSRLEAHLVINLTGVKLTICHFQVLPN